LVWFPRGGLRVCRSGACERRRSSESGDKPVDRAAAGTRDCAYRHVSPLPRGSCDGRSADRTVLRTGLRVL